MALNAPTYKNTGPRAPRSSRMPVQLDPSRPSGPANLNRPIPANKNSRPGAANTNSPPRQLPKPGWRPQSRGSKAAQRLRMLSAVSRYMNDRNSTPDIQTNTGMVVNRITGARLEGENNERGDGIPDSRYFNYRGAWRWDPSPDGTFNKSPSSPTYGNPWAIRHAIRKDLFARPGWEFEFWKPDRDGDYNQWYNFVPDYLKPAGPEPIPSPFEPAIAPQWYPNPNSNPQTQPSPMPSPRSQPRYKRAEQPESPKYMTVIIPPNAPPRITFQNNPGGRPPRGQREKKARNRLVGFISGILDTGTELMDLLGVFADAAGLKTNDPREQAILLFYHGSIFRMDLETLITGLIYNEIEDRIAGRFFGGANKRLRQDFGAYVTTLPI